ncbi:MAG: DUF1800 domain-containing protein [Candidatus Kapaibacteriota bacterium]
MDRRHALQQLIGWGVRPSHPTAGDMQMLQVEAGLEPYTQPLTLDDVLHLYRRLSFSASMEQAAQQVGRQASDVVEELLGTGIEQQPASPGAWVNVWTENPRGADLQTRAAIERSWQTNMAALGSWWLSLMTTDPSAVEKLTLFWSQHWSTEFSFDNTYSVPQMLYRQLGKLRQYRLGDIRQLALEITLDPAMLYYLGGTYNTKGAPNENYARELMELYLTGLGWYTEGDVKEGARILTGWRSQRFSDEPAPNDRYETWFDAAAHDMGAKQFLGQTIAARTEDNNTAFQVRNEEVLRMIEIIVDVRSDAVARFLAEKVYRYFVYSSPTDVDQTMVAGLGDVLKASNFEMRPMFFALFTSAHFFDPQLRGVQIKTPMEYIAGLLRQLGKTATGLSTWASRMDQAVMDPPTVAGWPGYRAWMSTNTYPVRREFARTVIQGMSDQELGTWIRSIDGHDAAESFVRTVLQLLLPVAVTEERFSYYLQALLQNAPAYDWPVILDDQAAAAKRTRDLLITISKAPDFQLC